MIKEVKASEELNKKSVDILEKNLIKLCQLVKKYSKVKELDINPLIVNQDAFVVDARIVWE